MKVIENTMRGGRRALRPAQRANYLRGAATGPPCGSLGFAVILHEFFKSVQLAIFRVATFSLSMGKRLHDLRGSRFSV
jgi:hypothetical protein